MLCLTLTGRTLAENSETAARYAPQVDLVELRADFLEEAEWERLSDFPASVSLPVILTFRLPRDGGRCQISEARRCSLLASALDGAYGFIDLEALTAKVPLTEERRRLEKRAAELPVRVIRSLHDFSRVPGDLARRLKELGGSPEEIPKAAVTPRSSAELAELLSVYRETAGMDKILLGMGEWGVATRILAPLLGSLVTFCCAGSQEAAPGHLDPETMNRRYRVREIGKETAVFGIVGNPVGHSRSPALHNSWLHREGLDAVYVPFLCDDPAALLKTGELLNLRGLSVTVPHKEGILPLLDGSDNAVREIGACNTVVRRDGGWYGTNTDWSGFLAPLEQGRSLEGLPCVVIGAGGAARSVVYALNRRGARITVLNRTEEKARRLVRELVRPGYGAAYKLEKSPAPAVREILDQAELIVQTTSLGMAPYEGQDPLQGYRFHSGQTVYDIIYEPPETLLLQKAAAAGCPVLNGAPMLEAQGALQYRLFRELAP